MTRIAARRRRTDVDHVRAGDGGGRCRGPAGAAREPPASGAAIGKRLGRNHSTGKLGQSQAGGSRTAG